MLVLRFIILFLHSQIVYLRKITFIFKVIFDTDPAPRGTKPNSQKSHEIMSQAMIRGMQDEDNDQFVAYFLPDRFTIHTTNMIYNY